MVARTPNPRLRAALARQAERSLDAAEVVRGGGVLDDDVRRRLADLLEVCGNRELREGMHTHVRDKVGALTDAIDRAQAPRTTPSPPLHGQVH